MADVFSTMFKTLGARLGVLEARSPQVLYGRVETVNPLSVRLSDGALLLDVESLEPDLDRGDPVRLLAHGGFRVGSRAVVVGRVYGAILGRRIPASADLNDYTTPGQFYCPLNVDVATFTNGPPGDRAGSLEVRESAGVIQYWHEYGTGVSDGNVYRRRWYDGSWSAWTLYQGPALFESGSNGNGSWIRFPSNGLQVCWWHRYTTTLPINNVYGNLYLSSVQTWTYPRSFTSQPTVICGTFQWGTGASWGSVINIYGDYSTYRGFDNVSRASGTDVNVRLAAIGWATS